MDNLAGGNGVSAVRGEEASVEAAEATDTPTKSKKQVFRAHDVAGDDPAQKIAESVNRLEKVTKKLAAVMAQPNPPVAAVGSPAAGKDVDVEHLAEEVSRVQGLGRLKRTVLANGDVSYSLPLDNVRAVAAELVGHDREAFRECHRGGTHLELVGSSDRQLAAAMAFARQCWGGDDVILHVEGKHRDKVIEHAVRAGLNIANRDPEIQALVAKERQRQTNPLTRDRTLEERIDIPLIERVPSRWSPSR